MMRFKQIQLAIALMMHVGVIAQQSGNGDQKILIRYATAHVGNGQKIENALLAFQGDEITMLADGNNTRVNVLDYDSIIDAEGKHIYPGFIVMDSRLGLTEIGAVRATHDYRETGDINPNIRALPAFNAESKVVSTVRTNGVLMAQLAPVGGMLSGSSAVVHFNGSNWKEAEITEDGIYLNWPSRYGYQGWWAEPGSAKKNKKYADGQDAIQEFFAEAQVFASDSIRSYRNLKLEAMAPLFTGEKRLYIRANWAKDILDAIQFYRASGVKKMAIVGGSEAHLVTTELVENGIPVIIDRVHKLPSHSGDMLDQPFRLAADLVAKGVNVAFATSGDMEAMISRNLPFQVGTAVYYGLPYEKAIESLTLTPAKLMGIEKDYGTIESGKRATFFISEGDALDIKSNDVSAAFVNGKRVYLWNHQMELRDKYSKRKAN